ncbi:hypothetical protein ACPCHQ_16920 [Ralstonia thomasii]|jgi:hypothetical protein|uniref:Transcriptional regulator n=2 Tax=Ralstonia TaxID=48736 RepID=A0ABM9JW16_9RALS|nr:MULTISPECIES: hypothetical protein [Ralstonia]MBT2177769.1 hypothetical protein [Ralstonia pickettii]CAJ0710655.1 hypothetical protein LMG7143_01669 [Ralstonia sp. LMG 18095]CAJ0806398.1 hypothetical protein LMG18095_04436 [Ralstonia sp. LMG 18095]
MVDVNAHIRSVVLAAQEAGGKTTVVHARIVIGVSTTSTRLVLAEAVALGFLTVTKAFHADAVYQVTGKPLSDLVEEGKPLLARFEELLQVWGIPMLAPEGSPGRVHLAFS